MSTVVHFIELAFASAMVLYLPGWSLTYVLFPEDGLDRIERTVVAMGSSIALSSLLGAGLLRLFGNLSPMYFALSTVLLTSLFALIAAWRARRLGKPVRVFETLIRFGSTTVASSRLWIALLIVLVAAIMSVKAIRYLPGESYSSLTEFYVDPAELENILQESADGQSLLALPLQIHNLEPSDDVYVIEASVNGDVVWLSPELSVASQEVCRDVAAIPLSGVERPARVDLRLLSQKTNTNDICLSLWIPGNSIGPQ